MKSGDFSISNLGQEAEDFFSENFWEQVFYFVNNKIENDFRNHLRKNDSLYYNISGLELKMDEITKVSYYSFSSISCTHCGLFGHIQLCWRDKTGKQIVYPDQPFEGEIEFWFENYPTKEEIIDMIDSMKHLWEPRKVIKIVREPFTFKVRETRFFQDHYPHVDFTLKSKADAEKVTELLLQTFESYNETHEDQGVMHNISFKSASKGKMIFYIDAGSAPPEAIVVLLKALEKAKFDIESVTIG